MDPPTTAAALKVTVAPTVLDCVTGWVVNSGPPVTKLQVVPILKSLKRMEPHKVAPPRL